LDNEQNFQRVHLKTILTGFTGLDGIKMPFAPFDCLEQSSQFIAVKMFVK